MSKAATVRGDRLVSRSLESATKVAVVRATRNAEDREVQALRDRCRVLERDLARARRCIAELRRSKAARLLDAQQQQHKTDFAVSLLCKMAFPKDKR